MKGTVLTLCVVQVFFAVVVGYNLKATANAKKIDISNHASCLTANKSIKKLAVTQQVLKDFANAAADNRANLAKITSGAERMNNLSASKEYRRSAARVRIIEQLKCP